MKASHHVRIILHTHEVVTQEKPRQYSYKVDKRTAHILGFSHLYKRQLRHQQQPTYMFGIVRDLTHWPFGMTTLFTSL